VGKLQITYVKSSVGYETDQKQTVISLGLRKLGQSVEQADTRDVRGMIRKVAHLVSVVELEDE
jgi:large subunit ribosomal protein L30